MRLRDEALFWQGRGEEGGGMGFGGTGIGDLSMVHFGPLYIVPPPSLPLSLAR